MRTGLLAIMLAGGMAMAQEQPAPQSPCGEGKCGSKQSMVDCNDGLEFEQNTNTVYHTKSGKAFTGTCESCHFNGNRQHCASFRDGKEDGVSMTWYEDGTPQNQRMHVAGKENGVWLYWHPAKREGNKAYPGKLAWEMNYVEGQLNGTCRWYFEDGSEKKIENYKMGVLDGQVIKYARPGIKDKEMNYKAGLLDGSYKSFFENGNVQTELNYKGGKEDGVVKYYHENAQVALEGEYRMGVKVNKWTKYHPSGVDRSVENYNNIGQLHGMVFEYWDEGGKLKREAYYYNGEVAVNDKNVRLEQKYDEFGNPIDEFGNRVNPDDAINVQGEASRYTPGKKKKEKLPKSTFDFATLNEAFMCDCIKKEQRREPESEECAAEKDKFRKAMEKGTKQDQKKLRKILEGCMK